MLLLLILLLMLLLLMLLLILLLVLLLMILLLNKNILLTNSGIGFLSIVANQNFGLILRSVNLISTKQNAIYATEN